jgi:ATP-dependent DNA helicase RecG
MTDAPATAEKPPQDLTTPVQFLKGVGPQRAVLLDKLDLRVARDLLFFFPRSYQDLSDLRSIAQLEEGPLVSVRGTVVEVEQKTTSGGLARTGILIHDGHDHLRAMWFNQPYIRDKFHEGQQVLFSGKAKQRGLRWEMTHPRVEIEEEDAAATDQPLLPVYGLTEGLNQHQMRRLMQAAVDQFADQLEDVFDDAYLNEQNLLGIVEAIRVIHSPDDQASLDRARERLVYQELLTLQLAMAIRRHERIQGAQAPKLEVTAKIDARIRRLFPFELTIDQNLAIGEIASDLRLDVPMNRLLQGDVGCGKTIVAVYAMLAAVAHGYQVALMAPTEVLASQHKQTLDRVLAAAKVRCELLTGSTKGKERGEILERLAAGEVDILIGTHAVASEGVEFTKLGLVVVDEQHKFGVRQRAMLRSTAGDPHYLVMTATPIPRTVAMAIYGDLDVSMIEHLPPGRKEVHTYLATEEQQPKWWDFVGRKLREGRQAYVVAPLVDDSGDDDVRSVEQLYEELANGQLEAFRLAMIHGRMKSEEKQQIMDAFREGKTQVLVATSLIEVGVDVANATTMTIVDAERFGLAQLHQMRGRITRGTHAAYCCLLAEPKTETSRERLDAFVATTSGFELAELDFKLRGPGDLLGTRQHGLPPLRIADPLRDTELVERARKDADALLAADPELAAPEHARLRERTQIRYGQTLDLSDVS